MAALLANVLYRGDKAGVVFWDAPRRVAVFEFTPEFAREGVQLAPLWMPLRTGPYQFPALHHSYRGLPGLLADSLPDAYGNTLIDEWLRRQGRAPNDFSPVERLCYLGARGTGALERWPKFAAETKVADAQALGIERLLQRQLD